MRISGKTAILQIGLLLIGGALALVVASAGGGRQESRAAVEGSPEALVEQAHDPGPEGIAANWPRFRGPGGLGRTSDGNTPFSWDGRTGNGILWKTPVPLPGRNSPVVWGGRVFLTGATAQKQEVYCFDAGSGRLLWRRAVDAVGPHAVEAPEVQEDTGFAAPTVATDGQRVYAIFATGTVVCFDLAGSGLWVRNLGRLVNVYGHASSLTMYRNLLLVLLDQGSADDGLSALLAIDGRTGHPVWRAPRRVPASWASPIVISTEMGEQQVITCASPWVIAYNAASGEELWRVDCLGEDVAPSPIYAGGLVFAVQEGGDLVAIRPTGRGDVTDTHIAWTGYEGLPDICSPVSNGELVFLLTSDGGMLTCYDVSDGQVVWEKNLDASFFASPSLVGDRLYLLSQKGTMFMLEAGREYKELGRAELGEPAYTSPAFVAGRIYIRGEKHLYGIGRAE